MMNLLILLTLVSNVVLGASIFNLFDVSSIQSLINQQEVQQQGQLSYHESDVNTGLVSSENELLSLHKKLVDINSVTGNGESYRFFYDFRVGGSYILTNIKEFEIGEFLSNYLKSKGLTVELQQVSKNRNNIYAYFGSNNNNKNNNDINRNAKILLTTHIDTVPPFLPYKIDFNSGKIYGRGSVDAKASIVTQILSTLELYNSNEIKDGDVAFLFVVGEEYNGAGMRFANNYLKDVYWDHVIFGEPTECKLGIGHKGVLNFNLEIIGKSSHSGYPNLGIDANTKLINLLYKIIHSNLPIDELLGNSTINPGIIEAGIATNVISPIAKTKILIRISNDAEKVKEIIMKIIEDEDQEYHNIKFEQEQLNEPEYLNFTIPGFNSTVLSYFTDVPNLKRQFKSRYLYGPGTIQVAHSANEYVTIDELYDAVDGYKKLIKYLLNGE